MTLNDAARWSAVVRHARHLLHQWDNHDKYRHTAADAALDDPILGEPDDVAMAREIVRMADDERYEQHGN